MAVGEQSKLWFERATKHFPGGVNSPVRAFKSVNATPFVVEKGAGPFLFDLDGRRYVDYVCSWGPLVIGHAHPVVVAAINAQAVNGTSYGANSVPEVQLAELIKGLMPSIEMLRFVNSGTEAGMAVLRLARAFTGRELILKFNGCYHGHADSLLVHAGSGVLTLGLPDSPGVTKSAAALTLSAPFNDQKSVENIFAKYGSQIAAVIVEGVVGNSGFILPQNGFLSFLRDITSQHGSLYILDEVMTGFRVSLSGAQGHFHVTPDLTMLGKVIGGGLPVGAFGGRRDIMEMIAPAGPVYQAGTLSGNPLAMAAGQATLTEWCKPGSFESATACALTLVAALKENGRKNTIPIQAENLGSMFGFFFCDRPIACFEDTQYCNKERFIKFFHLMLERGVYFAPSPFEAGFLSSAHTGEALEHTLKMVREVFSLL
jgi:glutamate-1-semialdehyde 2,1-aminomutase